MRSKVANRIQNETPKGLRFFVRGYINILLKVGKIFKQKVNL